VRFQIVGGGEHACPYLPGQTARTPLRIPVEEISPDTFDALLEAGFRRAGPFFYRPECPTCSACEPLRLPIARLSPSGSQRRVLRAHRDEVEVTLGPAEATARHVEIFNRHGHERGLAAVEDAVDLASFRAHFVESGLDTRQASYLAHGRLVAFSILDVGRRSVSSVYHAFDPDESRRSLGVFSVLREAELFGALGFEWYYLGLWAGGCRSLAYKAGYHPHQRLRDGAWHEHDRADRHADAPPEPRPGR